MYPVALQFIVLPLIAQQAKQLLAEEEARSEEPEDVVDVLVPASFDFPHSAKLLSLSFLLFAAWYSGGNVDAFQVPILAGAGLLSLFGSLNAAIPFLLDLLRLPADLMQLFTVSGIVNSHFGSMAAAMHTFVFAILGAWLMAGRASFNSVRLLRFLLGSLAITLCFLLGSRFLLARILPLPDARAEMRLSPREPLAPVTIDRTPPPPPTPAVEPGRRLRSILAEGRLRVGYAEDAAPWSY